jgi:hypothetical protein
MPPLSSPAPTFLRVAVERKRNNIGARDQRHNQNMGRARGHMHAVAGTARQRFAPPPPTLIHTYDTVASTASKPVHGELPDYNGFLLEFPRELDERERELVRGSTCYAAFLPHFANGTDVNEWLSPRHFWIDANSAKSRSSNWREREPFALLEDFIVNGTPTRVRANNTRKWEGIGVAPSRIILNHPGDKAPAPEIEFVHFEREGRQPAPSQIITDPRDLLRIRIS